MNDKLYIIGNGFDLHHNIKTSYKDFRDNFARNNQYLWKTLKSLYGNKIEQDMWWSSFEEMLGRIDYHSLMYSLNNGLALGPTVSNSFFTNNLPVFFGKWIEDVNEGVKSDEGLMIDRESQFFSFNYTMLLEKAYRINDSQIWHIHNSISDIKRGSNLIVGHDSDDRQVFSYMKEYSMEKPINRIDIADDINREVIKGAKKVTNRVAAHHDDFYRRFSSIRHYISMGFSYNNIDLPYIEKIAEVNNSFSDADWLLYSHTDQERDHLYRIMQRIGVNINKVSIVNW